MPKQKKPLKPKPYPPRGQSAPQNHAKMARLRKVREERAPKWRDARPLLFQPQLIPKVWGDPKLGRSFGQEKDEAIGEVWLASDHPKARTPVAKGPLAGLTIGEALKELDSPFPGVGKDGSFPLLIKILKSRHALSVQVHPDDEMAQLLEGDVNGKTEAWFILASEGGHVGLGFTGQPKQRNAQFLGSTELLGALRRLEVQPNDFLLVPGREIHYVGSGVTLLEVQQTSDRTYRIHDWQRQGRDLHLEKAAQALCWTPRKDGELLTRNARRPDFGASCPFSMERLCINSQKERLEVGGPSLLVPVDPGSLLHWPGGTEDLLPWRCWLIPGELQVVITNRSRSSLLLVKSQSRQLIDKATREI